MTVATAMVYQVGGRVAALRMLGCKPLPPLVREAPWRIGVVTPTFSRGLVLGLDTGALSRRRPFEAQLGGAGRFSTAGPLGHPGISDTRFT